jgi:hypothetical protein
MKNKYFDNFRAFVFSVILEASVERPKNLRVEKTSPFSKREIERDFLIPFSLYMKREISIIAHKKNLNKLSARCVI